MAATRINQHGARHKLVKYVLWANECHDFHIFNDVENLMTVYFITRHIGALEWANEQDVHFDVHLSHLTHFDDLQASDTVIGTLPIHLVADLNARGIRYVHLSMHVPVHLRGIELSAQQLHDCQIQLEEFYVTRR